MPLFYSHHIDESTRLAIWHIAEPEAFFQEKVPASRSISHHHKRLQHLAGRYLLQYLFPDFPLQLIQVATTKKPFLPNESHHFSISHCGNYAAAIVSTTKRVGIDIEEPVTKLELLASKFLNEKEQQFLPENQHEKLQMLTLLWSAKEAMFKWYSHGGIDFKRHLLVNEIKPNSRNVGNIVVTFNKEQPLPLTVSYHLFDGLVLSWVL